MIYYQKIIKSILKEIKTLFLYLKIEKNGR